MPSATWINDPAAVAFRRPAGSGQAALRAVDICRGTKTVAAAGRRPRRPQRVQQHRLHGRRSRQLPAGLLRRDGPADGRSGVRLGAAGIHEPRPWCRTSGQDPSSGPQPAPGRTRNIHRPEGVTATGPRASPSPRPRTSVCRRTAPSVRRPTRAGTSSTSNFRGGQQHRVGPPAPPARHPRRIGAGVVLARTRSAGWQPMIRQSARPQARPVTGRAGAGRHRPSRGRRTAGRARRSRRRSQDSRGPIGHRCSTAWPDNPRCSIGRRL
jgi:hypothetical protein